MMFKHLNKKLMCNFVSFCSGLMILDVAKLQAVGSCGPHTGRSVWWMITLCIRVAKVHKTHPYSVGSSYLLHFQYVY